MKKLSKKRLVLDHQVVKTLVELTQPDLQQVVGGRPGCSCQESGCKSKMWSGDDC